MRDYFYFVMLIPINENVIAGEGDQTLPLLKIFYSTRDPDKKIGANLNGIPACLSGRQVSFVNQFKKNSHLARNDTLMKMSSLR